MDIQEEVETYIAGQAEPKQSDMRALHSMVLRLMPGCRLWFLDGKNDQGKVVSNPNIGYGFYTMRQAGGRTRDFYQIGMSGNTTGTSIYIIGIEDKKYLSQTYGKDLGKASISGYCIKFKSLKDVKVDVLEAMIRDGIQATSAEQLSR